MFSFLANMTLSIHKIQQGVELLMEAYPQDVGRKLANELLHQASCQALLTVVPHSV